MRLDIFTCDVCKSSRRQKSIGDSLNTISVEICANSFAIHPDNRSIKKEVCGVACLKKLVDSLPQNFPK